MEKAEREIGQSSIARFHRISGVWTPLIFVVSLHVHYSGLRDCSSCKMKLVSNNETSSAADGV